MSGLLQPSRNISLKKTLMSLLIILILIFLVSITLIFYLETDKQISEVLTDNLHRTEYFLISASDRITKGQMLWEATYKRPLLTVADAVNAKYIESGRDPSLMDLEAIINGTNQEYRDRIDILLINNTGVVEFSTKESDLYLDFKNWGTFYSTITDIRLNDTFVLDRAARGFDTNNPYRIFGYLPTDDNQYLIEIIYRIYEDFKTERSELSFNYLIEQAKEQDPNILELDLIGSTGMVMSGVSEVPHEADPVAKTIASDVYTSRETQEYSDDANKTLTRYFYIDSGDYKSPASDFVNHVGRLVYSTRQYHDQKTFLTQISLVFFILSIVVALLLAYLLSRILFSPVDTLIHDLDIITRGNLNHKLRPSRHQEINRIAEAVTSMVTAIKTSIRSLESSEKRYFSIFSYASDAIILWDGREVINANPAALALFRWNEQETDETIIQAQNDLISSLLKQVPDKDKEKTLTVTIPERGVCVISIQTVSMMLEEGNMEMIHIRDVTEETRMHEEIHRLADIVRNTQVGILAGKNTPELVNDAYAQMHGFTHDEALSYGFFGPVHPGKQEMVAKWLETAKETGHVSGEAIRIRSDGTKFLCFHDLTMMSTEDGGEYLILNIQDMTDQVQLWKVTLEKDNLSNSLDLLKNILQYLPDPTFVIDTTGKVIAWNREMETFTDVTAEEVITEKTSYAKAIYHEERPVLIDLVIRPDLDIAGYYDKLQLEEGIYSAEVHFDTPSGKTRYIWITASPLYDTKGELIGAIETIREISDLKNALKTLSDVNDKLMLLSSVTRHDIGNKMTAIDGLRYIALEESTEERVKDLLVRQKGSIVEIGKLISFSKAYQEIGIHEPVWHQVKDKFLKTAQQVARESSIIYDIPDIEIFADGMLEKVFYNLAENSIRHGKDLTTISLSWEMEGENGVLVYEDDGGGVMDAEKTLIFSKGFGKNTGLGLFLISQILAITGITITETGKYGQGVRFEISIPSNRFRMRE